MFSLGKSDVRLAGRRTVLSFSDLTLKEAGHLMIGAKYQRNDSSSLKPCGAVCNRRENASVSHTYDGCIFQMGSFDLLPLLTPSLTERVPRC